MLLEQRHDAPAHLAPRGPCRGCGTRYRRLLLWSWTSGSTGTEISGRDLSGKRPLHRLIDFTASGLESYQKGGRKQQDWRPAKSRSFLQRFGRSERISFLIDKSARSIYHTL